MWNRTCKVYRILNRVHRGKNVVIRVDSYLKKKKKTEFQVIFDRKRDFKIVRKSLIHVDSSKEIDKYLKRLTQKTFSKE